ncbi:YcnI family protein [uncultured Friedmanniella sp.]|uniref:YcnI family copper-binding membrane protein n=1 Tax=uncultured Friedmanniella sp. TaxID=335381 RepID=UPI0035C9963C
MTIPSRFPRPSGARRSTRIGAAVAAAGLLTFAAPVAAQAHVRVLADSTAAGSDSALTFLVPTESATASTVKISVQLPQQSPFLEVNSEHVPGWTVSSTEEKLPTPATMEGTTITKAVRTVTWTAAEGEGIAPDEYQEFSLSVAPLPAAGPVLLPVTQTYSDGTVVQWDQPTPASGEEPEHPAPELVVTAATTEPESSASPPPASTVTTTAASTTGSDGVARGLGVAALAVAVAGLAVALLRGRRRTA